MKWSHQGRVPQQREAMCGWDGMGDVDSCNSWCLNAKGKESGLEVPPFLTSPQSTDSRGRQFAWKVLEARASGLWSFCTTKTTSLEMRSIQLDCEGKWPVLFQHREPEDRRLSGYRSTVCPSHVRGLFSLGFILMTFTQRGPTCELPLINGLSSLLAFSEHPLASPGL